MIQLLVALLVSGGLPSPTSPVPTLPEDSVPRVFQVEMVDISPTEFAFEPAEIRARPGDVIRFVQTGLMPHNVEFRDVPDGARLEDAKMGPFLMQRDETYDIVIDERFVPGTYPFLCTPHVTLGMTGTIIVEEAASSEGGGHPQEVHR